ncbi:MAG: beta-galactosidase [Pseudomonadota bacterium]
MKLGVCYYPEHWPETAWADDAACMAALGLTYVRIGEFAWSRLEPEPGVYAWAWLDRAIETLGAAGLKVILGTPTATPPKWLVDAYPQILAYDRRGHVRRFGSRRHYCFSSPDYRREAGRIVEAMARRYGAHPAIAMWQTDNEYGCHDTVESFSPAAAEAFRAWLADRYGSIDALNNAWGTVFWSMTYRSFDEVDPPLRPVTEPHPAHVLDWRRFSSDQVQRFNRSQSDIIRTHSPDLPITHNFMGHFPDFDHYDVGRDLEIATWDSYPLGFLETAWWDSTTKVKHARTGHPDFAAFHHDLYRGVGGGRFGVMEQQPGPVNWSGYNPAPLPGMVKLWTLEAAAHGAEFVSYFRWRQVPFGQEQLHAGLNRPDRAPDIATGEAHGALEILDRLGNLKDTKPASVALIYDYPSQWALKAQPQGRSFQYDELVFAAYSALRRAGLNVDVCSQAADFSEYRAVVVPSVVMMDDTLVSRLAASGAEVLFGPRSGSRTRDFQLPVDLPPGLIQDKLPLKVARVESLRPGVALSGRMGEVLFEARRWREFVETDLLPEATLEDGTGALFRNGRFRYLSVWPDDALLDGLIAELARAAGLETLALPEGLRMRRRGDLTFVTNYGPGTLSAPDLARLFGQDQLIGDGPLPPAGLAVFSHSADG